jgi:glycosyltransferase involved in cell wall biosynthesis
MSPFFSVIIPTHNRAQFLKQAVDSVLNQTFQDFEIIIIDDLSTDNTAELVRTFNDVRIKYFRNEVNLKCCRTRNVGIELSKGMYVTFLDDDDYFMSTHLTDIYDGIKKSNFQKALFFTYVTYLHDESGQLEKKEIPPIGESEDPLKYLFSKYFPITSSMITVHSEIIKQNHFDTRISFGEDTELVMKIALHYPIIRIPIYSVILRKHPENSGNDQFNHGLMRLKDSEYIFSNQEYNKRIPRKIKRELYAHCFFKMAVYYDGKGEKLKAAYYALKSTCYCLLDPPLRDKAVLVLYNLPILGGLIKFLYRAFKL